MNNHTTAKCTFCKSVIIISAWYKKQIRDAINRSQNIIPILCPNCKEYFTFTIYRETVNIPKNFIRCPELFCPGYLLIETKAIEKKKIKVDLVNAARHCSECGEYFASRKALDDAIEKMVEKYPHRKMVYKKGKDGHWENVFPEKSRDSERYEELLEEIEMADWDKAQAEKKTKKKASKPAKKM